MATTVTRTVQFATRSSSLIVTSLVASLLRILTSQAEGELRYGVALPSICERSLKKLLADMGDDSD